MMRRLSLFAGAALVLVSGCSNMRESAASPTDTTVADNTTPTAAMPYVTMAGAGDLYEIQSSQLALRKSQDANVRDFAQRMISDHTNTTTQLMTVARSAALTPPAPKLTPMQQAMIAQLQPLSGADFDRSYVSQQLKAHGMALKLHKNYAANGDTPALRSAASAAVPIIQRHYDRVQQLADSP